MKIHGWGRYPSVDATILTPQSQSECANFLKDYSNLIARGLGRSYGDSANNSVVIQSSYFDHFIELDNKNGILTCEAGISIRDILEYIVPRGWFIPVTPGTSYVTIGGAIASDVHGKNHHANGAFSNHLIAFKLMIASGEILCLSRSSMPDLFHATCGGMGLTGIILTATIKLQAISSSYILQNTYRICCLEEVCLQLEANAGCEYTVAWIDCLAKGSQLGRSLLFVGEHEKGVDLSFVKRKSLTIPFEMPSVLLNHASIKAFNFIYYHKSIFQKKLTRLSYQNYFYPLDSISNWNQLYGKQGFIQYQFVIPKNAGLINLKKILSLIVESGKGSFLAVLKIFGEANKNYLSFPIEGYTLALDFKMSSSTVALIHKLDQLVVNMGGRIYLTKDSLMSEETFKVTYPQWEKFQAVREQYGAIGRFSSNQSRRLGLQ